MWKCYYSGESDYGMNKKIDLLQSLLGAINSFTDKEKRGLIKIYSESDYDYRGAPDLFVFNQNKEKQFIEVKSYRDSLRFEQLLLASKIINNVGCCYSINYVLPNNLNKLEAESRKRAILKIEAAYINKLVKKGSDVVYSGYMNHKEKTYFATNDCGVSFNSMIYFINKTKGLKLAYDEAVLRSYGINLHEYVNNLEMAYIKIINVYCLKFLKVIHSQFFIVTQI